MMNLLPGITSTSSALNAERIRLEIISQNIANSNNPRALDGKPYQRQQVVFESVLQNTLESGGVTPRSVQVARITQDNTPARPIHDPQHPYADANGNIYVPEIDVHREMVDLMVASRAYEANLAVVRNARSMVQQTLTIGKRS